jgi:hypothetical protein
METSKVEYRDQLDTLDFRFRSREHVACDTSSRIGSIPHNKRLLTVMKI